MDIKCATTGYSELYDKADEEKRALMSSAARRFMKLYQGMDGTIERARFFNELADDFFQKQILNDPENAKRIYCKEGCSSCCHLPVVITSDEADSMYAHMIELGLDVDYDKLKKQSSAGKEGWESLSMDEKRCLFLDKNSGSCQIHKHRPNSCRNHLVLDSNEFCGTVYDEKRKSYAIPLCHVSTTAAFNSSETGVMAKMLYPRLSPATLDEWLSH